MFRLKFLKIFKKKDNKGMTERQKELVEQYNEGKILQVNNGKDNSFLKSP